MVTAVSDDLRIPVDTKGPRISFTVYDNDGTAHDLTGLTVTFKVWKPKRPGTLIVEGSVTLDVAASGTCYYVITDDDFKKPGTYKWELELTKANYQDQTDPGELVVTESG
ncbi:MAG: BppU family phage baseplate upper protein [Planctomycetota bacterium]|jgi:hypothetical protein